MSTTMLSKDDILEAIGKMSVLDLADLIEAFKTKFNVSVVAAGAAPAAAAAPAAEEQTEFAVILKSGGDKKIQVIKAVRELTSLGLKEAKDLVDNGGTIKEGVTKAEATEMKKKLEDQGGVVELK
jgi:large subunit ribosomal protein L7/L12